MDFRLDPLSTQGFVYCIFIMRKLWNSVIVQFYIISLQRFLQKKNGLNQIMICIRNNLLGFNPVSIVHSQFPITSFFGGKSCQQLCRNLWLGHFLAFSTFCIIYMYEYLCLTLESYAIWWQYCHQLKSCHKHNADILSDDLTACICLNFI